MGFGSYDESEQSSNDVDFDEDEGVNTSESEHEGTVDFEIGASNDELLDRLEEMKEE
ncbi:DUF5786 family protein [Haloferax namakaokahaiae]|uniref:DUF5786 family protein n=1 Tax=Haloferax namakaokahaiae TaxID=1748331 RepID=A0ABD5ZHI2_9EURY